MKIRKTGADEIEALMELYERARIFMAEHGNPNQWGSAYPERNRIEAVVQQIRSSYSVQFILS